MSNPNVHLPDEILGKICSFVSDPWTINNLHESGQRLRGIASDFCCSSVIQAVLRINGGGKDSCVELDGGEEGRGLHSSRHPFGVHKGAAIAFFHCVLRGAKKLRIFGLEYYGFDAGDLFKIQLGLPPRPRVTQVIIHSPYLYPALGPRKKKEVQELYTMVDILSMFPSVKRMTLNDAPEFNLETGETPGAVIRGRYKAYLISKMTFQMW